MDKLQLKTMIDDCHRAGKQVTVSFCSHVPQEILEAAGFCSLRILHTENIADISGEALPSNLCPLVKEVYSLCQGDALEQADLIIAESSCDGKKKMYELLSRQDQLYYYQVPQGEDRSYVRPLILSECRWLIRMLQQRFAADVTSEGLLQASQLLNAERQSVMSLMAVQKQTPPAAWGCEILQILEQNRTIYDTRERTGANENARESLIQRSSPVPKDARRILVTGCPASGVYRKIVNAVEKNGGVAVCFENCEVVKSCRRQVDTANPDILGAIADCYQDTACAIMAPNQLRFQVLEQLIDEYQVEGILDLSLQTCHAYTVERDKMRRFCQQKAIPYLPVETGFTDADSGQIETRVSAFIEML